MFKFFARLFGYVLNFIYNLVSNYGLAIIIFTIVLRLILLPINWKQQKTMKKSAKVQEKLKEIQDKYSNDPVRFNEEVKNLYASEKMSPFSGCLGSILQFVIIISMFMLVSNPLTYMKQLPSDQIAAYEEQVKEENNGQNVNYLEIAVIKSLGKTDSAVNINMNFLGLDLSDVPSKNYSDPKVFIIPILYVMTSFASMKLTTAMNAKKNKNNKKELTEEENKKLKEEQKLVKVDNKDEEIDTMESMNKSMMYMMPLMTVSIALIAPLGLALYWFVSNLLMILERLAVNKFVKEEEE
jgi:YidC/Oxa1 family membrane protein insertase